MSAGEDDLGLDLRLPWGRPKPPPPPIPPEGHATAGAPPPSSSTLPAAPPSGPADPLPPAPAAATAGADSLELQRSLRTLMLELERRFDGIDKRLVHVDIGLPERLELIETLLEAQAAASEGTRQPDAAAIVEQVDLHMALAGQDLTEQVDLHMVLAGQDLAGRIERALTGQGLEARIDRLENLVVASHETTIEKVGELAAAGGEARAVASEEGVAPALDARLDRLEALVDASHNLMIDAVGRPAPGPAASRLEQRLEERLDGVEAELRSRLDQLEHRVEEAHQATIAAIGALPAAELVGSLIEGVVTTGEMLDAELMDLKRMLVDQQPADPPGDRNRSN